MVAPADSGRHHRRLWTMCWRGGGAAQAGAAVRGAGWVLDGLAAAQAGRCARRGSGALPDEWGRGEVQDGADEEGHHRCHEPVSRDFNGAALIHGHVTLCEAGTE